MDWRKVLRWAAISGGLVVAVFAYGASRSTPDWHDPDMQMVKYGAFALAFAIGVVPGAIAAVVVQLARRVAR